MRFIGSKALTVGAEWELQLVDKNTVNLAARAPELLETLPSSKTVKPEFIQSCVEVATPVCDSSAQIAVAFATDLSMLRKHAELLGLTFCGAGTHPFCRRLARISSSPRYERLEAEAGYLGYRQITFALHVHVGVPSGDAAMRVMRFLRPCVPLLVAASANSPFWHGHDTGFACFRLRILAAARSYGLPPSFVDWSDFEVFMARAIRSGAAHTIKDIHWDIRPHPDFGTVEIRVMDAQSCIAETETLVALVRCLVAYVLTTSDGELRSGLPSAQDHWVDRENYFRASHSGLDAPLIVRSDGATELAGNILSKVIHSLSPSAQRIGEADALGECAHQLRQRLRYRRLRKMREAAASMPDLTRHLVRLLADETAVRADHR